MNSTSPVDAAAVMSVLGTLDSNHLRSMLADKQVRHSLLLVALQEGSVLGGRLPAADVAALMQHAQMLAAAAEVLAWQRGCEAAASSSEDGSDPGALLAVMASPCMCWARGLSRLGCGIGQSWHCMNAAHRAPAVVQQLETAWPTAPPNTSTKLATCSLLP